MAFTYLSSGSGFGAAADNKQVTVGPLNTTNAKLILIGRCSYEPGSIDPPLDATSATVPGSPLNTWVPLTAREWTSGGRVRIWYSFVSTTSTTHYFFSTDNAAQNFPTLFVLSYNAAGTVSFVAEQGNVDTTSSITSLAMAASVNPGGTGRLWITPAVFYYDPGNSPDPTVNNSFTVRGVNHNATSAMAGAIAELIQATASTINPTWSWQNGTAAATALALFADGGAAGGPVISSVTPNSAIPNPNVPIILSGVQIAGSALTSGVVTFSNANVTVSGTPTVTATLITLNVQIAAAAPADVGTLTVTTGTGTPASSVFSITTAGAAGGIEGIFNSAIFGETDMNLGDFYVDDYVTFAVTTRDPTTKVSADATSVPSYRLYADENPTPIIASGVMAKLDDAGTTGYYSERIQLTTAAGFSAGTTGTCYNAEVVATVAGVTDHMNVEFRIIPKVTVSDISGQFALKKNTGGQHLPFFMRDSTNPILGKTGVPTMTKSLDGVTGWSSVTGTVTEIGNGAVDFVPSAADCNATLCRYKASMSGAVDDVRDYFTHQ